MNHQLRIWSVFAILFLVSGSLWAQSGPALQFNPSQITAQIFQPAYLLSHDFDYIGIGGDVRYGLASNVLPVNAVLMDDSFITPEEKDLIVGNMGDDNRLNLGLYQSIFTNFRIKKTVWSLSYQGYTGGYFRTNSANTLGLVLYGNAAYNGQTVSDQNIRSRIMSHREFALGSAWEIGALQIGVRAKLLMGQNANLINDFSYSLFTSENGGRINLTGDYDIFRSQSEGVDGMGLGIDLGLVYPINQKVTLQAAFRDLGSITWDGVRFQNQVDVDYEGVEITNILNTNLSNPSDFFSIDTLQNLFFPDSAMEKVKTNLPGSITLGATYQLDSLQRLHLMLQAGVSEFSLGSPLPLILIGYERNLGKFFTLGAHVYG
ncbi:MAG: hypothetical protein KDD63_25510, partial [Bacteroidetes bacterium]|nr:hypothetical protein [Bacteroidota bacterium]